MLSSKRLYLSKKIYMYIYNYTCILARVQPRKINFPNLLCTLTEREFSILLCANGEIWKFPICLHSCRLSILLNFQEKFSIVLCTLTGRNFQFCSAPVPREKFTIHPTLRQCLKRNSQSILLCAGAWREIPNPSCSAPVPEEKFPIHPALRRCLKRNSQSILLCASA